jgi:hypothetical protein
MHMAEVTFHNENVLARPKTDWAAIWAGTFTFVAVWAVFGSLGYAIFGGLSSPGSTSLTPGAAIGMSIWAIILTIIAMYVAGLETGRLAMVTNRHDGLIHGMIMFGLSTMAVAVLMFLARGSLGITTAAGSAATQNPYLLDMTGGTGWVIFLALILGWLAAMGGASNGVQRSSTQQTERAAQPIRPAA